MSNKLRYSAPVGFVLGTEPKTLFCECEVKNIPLSPGNDLSEFRALLWFPNCKLSKQEEQILGLKSYLPDSRNHCQQYLFESSDGTVSSFPDTVHLVLMWFESKKPTTAPVPQVTQKTSG